MLLVIAGLPFLRANFGLPNVRTLPVNSEASEVSKTFNKYAKWVNAQMQDVLHDRQYYWVSARSEYSTDILFKRRQDQPKPGRILRGAFPGNALSGTLYLGRFIRDAISETP